MFNKEVLLLKYGEIILKGANKYKFEEQLLKELRRRLEPFGSINIYTSQSTVYAEPSGEFDMDGALEAVRYVFGLSGYTRAAVTEKNINDVSKALNYLEKELNAARTFKVDARRSDKKFPYTSPEIMRITGEAVLEKYPHLTVDVHNPDVIVMVEIREDSAFLHTQTKPGAGGMPVGTNGRAALLISGGIDSPVAGYMMARRGVELMGVHFYSHPYTSERSLIKVQDLLRQVSKYTGKITLKIVPFTAVQESIRSDCDADMNTIVMRRFMMKISEILAIENNCQALITGESIGQVASQTMHSLAVTDDAVSIPVFRPLIGMDKSDIIVISRKIETYDISIQPFDDCCTIFTPRHPVTKPTIRQTEQQESRLDAKTLIQNALNETTEIIIDA